MDMVSFESKAEQDFIEGLMKSSNIRDVHNAGRLCDAEVEGCDADRFKPLNINGWFWASTLRMMPPTNLRSNRVVSHRCLLTTLLTKYSRGKKDTDPYNISLMQMRSL